MNTKNSAKPKSPEELLDSEILQNIPKACSDELKAVEFIEQQRWGENPACPRCGDIQVKQLKDKLTGERNKRFLWACGGCKRQFTVKIGSVMEDSRIPYRHWCFALWASCASKKGVSAMQVSRQTGLAYKSALFLMHRIRFAMEEPTPVEKMTGEIQVDEVYLGGKEKNRHANKKSRNNPDAPKKVPVVAMIEAGGNVRAVIVPRANGITLRQLMYKNISRSAHVFTDESVIYARTKRIFRKHQTVNHSIGQYVNGRVTTNAAESFFALIRRSLMGTFHSVSRKHLHRYLGEIQFKYNTRKLGDGRRLSLAIQRADGKRLTYRALVAKGAVCA